MEGPPKVETSESREDPEARIEQLLKEMDVLNEDMWSTQELEQFGTLFTRVSEEVQDEWYIVEQEANVGKDREQAAGRLEKFIKTLKVEAEKLKSTP